MTTFMQRSHNLSQITNLFNYTILTIFMKRALDDQLFSFNYQYTILWLKEALRYKLSNYGSHLSILPNILISKSNAFPGCWSDRDYIRCRCTANSTNKKNNYSFHDKIWKGQSARNKSLTNSVSIFSCLNVLNP